MSEKTGFPVQWKIANGGNSKASQRWVESANTTNYILHITYYSRYIDSTKLVETNLNYMHISAFTCTRIKAQKKK